MIEQEFRDYLANLGTAAQDKVFYITVPQGETFPALTIHLTSKDRQETQTGLSGAEISTFNIGCHYSGDYPQTAYLDCKALVNSLVSGINTYTSGTITGVYALSVGNETDEQFYYLDGNSKVIATVTLEVSTYFTQG